MKIISKFIALNCSCISNPATEVTNIIISCKGKGVTAVRITDMTGRTIGFLNFATNEGTNTLTIDVSNISAVNYQVIVKNDEIISQFQVIIN
ncbi:MAG: T9SS type A sorting domain-containing protein [Crocinitomicaceae bacterium]|nr:T9SS type A sorting domain-containing protein [Crocinitomicaceae bacterium]